MYRLGELFYYHGLDTPLAESAVVAERLNKSRDQIFLYIKDCGCCVRYLNESADLGNPDAQHLKAVLVSTGITSARLCCLCDKLHCRISPRAIHDCAGMLDCRLCLTTSRQWVVC